MSTSWQRSSFCSGADCVEVRTFPSGYVHIRVRSPSRLNRDPLVITPDEWAAFLAGAKAGEFDPPGAG